MSAALLAALRAGAALDLATRALARGRSRPPIRPIGPIRRIRPPFWSESDLAFLRAHYNQDLSATAIARTLNRSLRSIYAQADILGLGHPQPSRRPGLDNFIRAHHALGWSDAEIAAAWGGIQRRSLRDRRRALGLGSNALSEHFRRRVAEKMTEQCRAAGVANLGALRAKVLRERSEKAGWPAGLSWRAGQILTLLWRNGPMTRRELVEAIRPDLVGQCTTTVMNRAMLDNRGNGLCNQTSYLGNLLRRGLIVQLGRIVRTGRPGGNRQMYMLAPNVQPKHFSGGECHAA